MKMCSKCNQEMPDEYGFCISCGAKQEPESAAAPAEVSESEEPAQEAEVKADETETEPVEKNEEKVPETAAEVVAETTEAAAETTEAVSAPVNTAAPAAPAGGAPEKKSGGKKAGIIAGVIALAAVVSVSAMAFMKSDFFKDPKDVVIDAFKSVYEDKPVNHLEDIFGFTGMAEVAKNQNTEVGFSIKYDGSSVYYLDEFAGSGMTFEAKNDIENKKSSVLAGVQYQGMDLLHADIYLDENEIMMAIPELSAKVFTLDYANDLQGQIERSPFLGPVVAEAGIDLDAFSEYVDYIYSFENEEERPFNMKALWERYKTGSQAIDNLKAAMTVEKGVKAVRMVDGKEQNCNTYNVVIPGTDIIQFFQTSSDFFLGDETLKKDVLEYLTQVLWLSQGMSGYSYYGYYDDPEEMRDEAWSMAEKGIDDFLNELEEYMQDDLEMVVTADKAGRLVALDAETVLSDSESELYIEAVFHASLKGGEYLTQNFETELIMTNDGEAVVFTLNKTESFDGNLLLCDVDLGMDIVGDIYDITYSGSYQVDNGEYLLEMMIDMDGDEILLAMEGEVTTLEKGVQMVAVADSIRLENDGDYVEFSGSYAFKPLEGEVTVPEGTAFDILAATETEWYMVAMEIFSKVMELSSKLQY